MADWAYNIDGVKLTDEDMLGLRELVDHPGMGILSRVLTGVRDRQAVDAMTVEVKTGHETAEFRGAYIALNRVLGLVPQIVSISDEIMARKKEAAQNK